MTVLYPETPSPVRPASPAELPQPPGMAMRRPENYQRDPGLVDAVNVALMLRQPLIVTGEPGTGKTVLASSVAYELGLEPPLVFETKSSSQATDLFYIYDTLGRFTARQLETASTEPVEYIVYHALGEAIVRANHPDAVAGVLPSGYTHGGRRRSVVLIDEVEKAPRDFPNDVLNEIERMYFRIPELGNHVVEADPEFHPVVVMTNNSEKSLPDAFLRRCIYYHIPFPDADRLEQIVLARMPDFFDGADHHALLREVVGFTLLLRDPASGMEKKPGTSEVLNWLNAMFNLGAKPDAPLSDAEHREFARRSLPALVKISGDQEQAINLLTSWSDGAAG